MFDPNAPLIHHVERVFGSTHHDPKEFESVLMPGHLSLYGMARAIAFAATAHAAVLKINRGFDPNRNSGWVVLGLRLRTLKPVPLNTAISCTTWVAAIDGARLIREYELHIGNESLAVATQDLVLFDRDSRRAMLPPRAAREFLRGLDRKHSYELTIPRQAELLSAASIITSASSSDFCIDETTIDDNNHLNNSIYIRWLEQTARIHPATKLELGLEYLNEAVLGDTVTLKTTATTNATNFTFQTHEKTFAHGKCHLLSVAEEVDRSTSSEF